MYKNDTLAQPVWGYKMIHMHLFPLMIHLTNPKNYGMMLEYKSRLAYTKGDFMKETEEVTQIVLPVEIINDFEQLSGAAVKVYIFLRKMTGEITEPKWIQCGYDYVLAETHLTSKTSVRRAMIELVTTGWIIGFRRGYLAGAKRVANQYLLSPVKDTTNGMEVLIKMQDYGSKRNRASQ